MRLTPRQAEKRKGSACLRTCSPLCAASYGTHGISRRSCLPAAGISPAPFFLAQASARHTLPRRAMLSLPRIFSYISHLESALLGLGPHHLLYHREEKAAHGKIARDRAPLNSFISQQLLLWAFPCHHTARLASRIFTLWTDLRAFSSCLLFCLPPLTPYLFLRLLSHLGSLIWPPCHLPAPATAWDHYTTPTPLPATVFSACLPAHT